MFKVNNTKVSLDFYRHYVKKTNLRLGLKYIVIMLKFNNNR